MPWRATYADNFGLKRYLWRRFKVKVACGIKLSHSLDGYFGYPDQRHVIKYALKVWIACLDALLICRCGSTNWYLILFLIKPCFRLYDASLSRMWRFG